MSAFLVLGLRSLATMAAGDAPPWAQTTLRLTAGEHRRLQGFASPARRRQFLCGRRLLRDLLCANGGGSPEALDIDIDEQGRSHIPAMPGLFVSLSHSGTWCAAAISPAPIGIDLEDLGRDRDFLGLANAVHNPAQCALLRQQTQEARARQFYIWWTLKEAWLKRQGLGLDMTVMRSLQYGAVDSGSAASAVVEELGLVLALDGCQGQVLPATDSLGGHSLPWQCHHVQGEPTSS
jgi:phosphopantetheinyl transferase